ncbi:MAG: hypothetical protein JO223_23705 [Hyphomicrobiales bacterium]|nr:hypothetical protein [Hyphomicrobiales bacterium]
MPLVDRLGEARESSALSEEIGPHGYDDIDWPPSLTGARQQQRDKRLRLVLVRAAAKSKEFFELIDEQQQICIARKVDFIEPVDQSERATRESCVDDRALVRSKGVADRVEETSGQGCQR